MATNERTVTHGKNLPELDAGCWQVPRGAVLGNSVAATDSTQSGRTGYSTIDLKDSQKRPGVLKRDGRTPGGSSNGRRPFRS